MDLELRDKVAVVTGASVGIGREIAKVLASEGVQTAVIARRANLLATLRDEIERAGGPRPLAVPIDLYAPDAAPRIRDAALSAYGRVDILINNAGGSRTIPWDSPDAAWDESFSLNFTAVRRTTQALLPGMIERRWGRILCVTGSAEPSTVNAAVAAKAGVHAWAKGPLAGDRTTRDHDQLPGARADPQRADRYASAPDAGESGRVRAEHPARLFR